MAMMRFNIQCEKDTMKQKAMTCMFEGNITELCAMLCLLIERIYTAEVKKYGVKGLEGIHDMTQHTLEMVYKDVVDQYIKGGQDDNRDIQK